MADRRQALVLALCLLGAGALSVALGQDANWDLRNYHLYNPWALLEGRRGIDFLASGVQFYFNPTLDLPYYLLAMKWLAHKPRAVAFLAGLPYGVLVFLAWQCARTVVADMQVEARWREPLAAVVAAFGVSGSASVSQVGTTFNEVQVAVLVMAGALVLLRALREAPDGWITTRSALGAGLVFGVAGGLKLTAALYAPAAVLALFAAARGNLRSIRSLALFSLAWGAAFVLTYGWWAAVLYRELGNPFFPLFENFFPTHWLSATSWSDNRFKPHTLAQAVAYPLWWARSQNNVVTEVEFADPRFAIAWCAVVLLAALSLAWLARRPSARPQPRSAVFVVVFVVIAYLTWQKMFAVLRYAIPIEALLGIVLAVCAATVARRMNLPLRAPAGAALVVALLAVTAAVTTYPRWGRVPYSNPVVRTEPPVTLAPGSMVIVMGSPQSQVLPAIAQRNPGVRFTGLTGDMLNAREYGFWTTAVQRIREHAGPRYAIRPLIDPFPWFDVLPMLGLAIDPAGCRPLGSNLDAAGFAVCPVRPSAPPAR